jgi:hypothetical protein
VELLVEATASRVEATAGPVDATSEPVEATAGITRPIKATAGPVDATSEPVEATAGPIGATTGTDAVFKAAAGWCAVVNSRSQASSSEASSPSGPVGATARASLGVRWAVVKSLSQASSSEELISSIKFKSLGVIFWFEPQQLHAIDWQCVGYYWRVFPERLGIKQDVGRTVWARGCATLGIWTTFGGRLVVGGFLI